MSTSSRPFRGPAWFAVRTGLALACFVACSDDEDVAAPPPPPPELTIEGFLSSNGDRLERFHPGDTVSAPCDGRLTILVGPAANAGRLGEWDLRPPGACGRLASCAYLVARLFDESGTELAMGAASLVRIPLDVSDVRPAAAYRVTVELRQGTTGELVTVEDDAAEPVPRMAEATLGLEAQQCPIAPGSGGAPSGGSAPGEGGMGGSF